MPLTAFLTPTALRFAASTKPTTATSTQRRPARQNHYRRQLNRHHLTSLPLFSSSHINAQASSSPHSSQDDRTHPNSISHSPGQAIITTTSEVAPSSSDSARSAQRVRVAVARAVRLAVAVCAVTLLRGSGAFAALSSVATGTGAAAAASSTAAGSGLLAAFPALADPTSFLSGLTASFLLVLASEIGDKTFFISALLSMKYSRVLVLVGTMLALASMTVISVAIGQIFHALPASLNTAIPFDDYAAVALLLWFGFQNIRDGLAMRNEDEDELQDAKEAVAEKDADQNAKQQKESTGVRVIAETSSLIFLAEWGDKSMLATVALAAAKSPLGVIVGGVSGHFVASIIAVIGGSVLGRYISERNARLIGGVLFLVFAVLTIMGIY